MNNAKQSILSSLPYSELKGMLSLIEAGIKSSYCYDEVKGEINRRDKQTNAIQKAIK